jgi:hypothetical protein
VRCRLGLLAAGLAAGDGCWRRSGCWAGVWPEMTGAASKAQGAARAHTALALLLHWCCCSSGVAAHAAPPPCPLQATTLWRCRPQPPTCQRPRSSRWAGWAAASC